MTLAKTSWFAEDALKIHALSYKMLLLKQVSEFIYSCRDKSFCGTSCKTATTLEHVLLTCDAVFSLQINP